MQISKSQELFDRAKKIIPGGVNSPVRAFKSVGGTPLFMQSASGAYITDVDGNTYLDYVGSWGPFILGHNHPAVIDALRSQLERATSFGAPTELEVQLAEMISRFVPSMEMVRMVNSGTEATLSALRLARAFTNRHKVIKFEGCYHGHNDAFLIKAGSGALTLGEPDSPGVTPATAADTLLARFNDIESVASLIRAYPDQIAALIIEPVAGNMGVVLPKENFLHQLRQLCTDNGIVLIFDEVMTGFRVSKGGAQEFYGIRPDLTTLGKIIGGGLPVGAYGGSKEIMSLVAPSGPVYQAGTLSGNPLAMTAGIATLSVIEKENIYPQLASHTSMLAEGIRSLIAKHRIDASVNHIGSMICLFFTNHEVIDYTSALTSDVENYKKYFHSMLGQNIYLPPSQYESYFVSAAHTVRDIERTISAIDTSLQAYRR